MINYNMNQMSNSGGNGMSMSTGPGQNGFGAVNPNLISQQQQMPFDANAYHYHVDNQNQLIPTYIPVPVPLPDNFINLLNAAQLQSELFYQQQQQEQLFQHQHQMNSQSLFPYSCNDFTQSLLDQDFHYTTPPDMRFFSLNQLQIHSQSNSVNSSPAKSLAKSQPIDLYNNNNNGPRSRSSPFFSSSVSGDSTSPFQFRMNSSSSSGPNIENEHSQSPLLQNDHDQGQGQLFEGQNQVLNVNDADDEDIHNQVFERLDDLDFGVVPSNYLRHENKKFKKGSAHQMFKVPSIKRASKKIRKLRLEKLIRGTIEELVTYKEADLTEMIATNLKASKDLIYAAVTQLGKASCAKLFIKTLRLHKRFDGEAIGANGEKIPPWENFINLAFNSNLPKSILKNILNKKEPTRPGQLQSSIILNFGIDVGAGEEKEPGPDSKVEVEEQIILNDLKKRVKEDCKCKRTRHFDLIAFLLKKKKAMPYIPY